MYKKSGVTPGQPQAIYKTLQKKTVATNKKKVRQECNTKLESPLDRFSKKVAPVRFDQTTSGL